MAAKHQLITGLCEHTINKVTQAPRPRRHECHPKRVFAPNTSKKKKAANKMDDVLQSNDRSEGRGPGGEMMGNKCSGRQAFNLEQYKKPLTL